MKKRLTVGLLAAALAVGSLGCSGTQGSDSAGRRDCDYVLSANLDSASDGLPHFGTTHYQCSQDYVRDFEVLVRFKVQDGGLLGTTPTIPGPNSDFRLTSYIVTFTGAGGSIPGVHVPAPVWVGINETVQFISPTDVKSILITSGLVLPVSAKSQEPLRSSTVGESIVLDATISFYGHPEGDVEAECVSTLIHRFQVTNRELQMDDDPCDL